MERDPFKEYIKESEPDKRYKVYAWSTAIGLQKVDGLEPSEQLVSIALENIEGTPGEGDMIFLENGKYHISAEETAKRRERILRLQKNLFGE